ncbi:hypothetical protein [Pseudomonas asiatica]|uniref:hypothetical protein n=1 Tax=Pseudomonas asiatica TaxID=2219225 RepID=UPI0032EC2E0A
MVEASALQTLGQAALNGALPVPPDICVPCSLPGALFSLDGGDGCDQLLGIPSQNGVGPAWFRNNPWIRDQARNHRDTFLQQVLEHAGDTLGNAWLAEFHAFAASEKLQLVCIDDEIRLDELPPPVLDHMGERSQHGYAFALHSNFLFTDHKIYFATFTHVQWAEAQREEYVDEHGTQRISPPYTWHTPSGLYPIEQACEQLARHYAEAKARARFWQGVIGAAEFALGVLAFIPVVRGIKGTVSLGRYAFVALEAALAADAMVDGSSRMITGEGLSIGEQFFTDLARLANPDTAEARGKQVFMAINLALLLPAAIGGARWLMHKLRPGSMTTVRLDNAALSQEEVRRLGNRSASEVTVLETRIQRRPREGELPVTARELHSVERNASLVALDVAGGKADYAYMATTLRDRLVAMIQHSIGPMRMGGSLTRVVADAGEEALAAALVSHWKVKPENILGLSTHPSRPSQFGLKNKSDQGIDMLVYVPPPPSMTVRNPTTLEMRHHIDGLKGTAPVEELKFEAGTLLVIEVKTTLGKSKTPGFISTQKAGGKANLQRIQDLIRRKRQGWGEALTKTDPAFITKHQAIEDSLDSRKVSFLHAQVFFDSKGHPNTIVGDRSGIQINLWNQHE